MKVPTIGTMVRAQVSVFRCPEGTTGYVKAILAKCNGPEVIIETDPFGEITVFARDYPFFFDEGRTLDPDTILPASNQVGRSRARL